MDATAATITTHAPTYSCRETEKQVRSEGGGGGAGSTQAPVHGAPVHGYHANLQPAVGGCEEEGGDVVGVGELQQPLSEPGLVPAGTRRHI